MSSTCLHRITAVDAANRQLVTALLAELQNLFIRIKTPVGTTLAAVVRGWRQETDGTYVVELGALVTERLPPLPGLELLIAAQGLAAASWVRPVEVAS